MRKTLSCFLVAAVLALTPALIVRNRSGSSRDGIHTLWMGTKDIESSKKGINQIAGIGTSICFLLFSSEVSHAIGEDISYKLVINFPPFRVFLLPTFLISLQISAKSSHLSRSQIQKGVYCNLHPWVKQTRQETSCMI